ncbi:uncharacterized protein LY89DRAFT_650311 [Mollisia scopiformis]|uniref:AB hydrolase-1 domain-containing protein n=1 Tax=Mollisia scopiformis TaxID=149040 RepID=A0A194X3R9_MOLSC|nr:uncharacterized protein LY89DRAFT_650311 [Mollisia scopiformis]KUJ14467.1 hypothetical protein LY89DRAFT_650311 [Mollisia scopiformis]
MRSIIFTLASGAAAQSLQIAAGQSAQYLASNPGGAIPAAVQAPSISGFTNPTIQPSRGGLAVCVSGMVPVTASTSKNMKFNFDIPMNQSQVTQTFVADVTSGSPFTEQIMAGMQSVNGTYNISATFCTPANNTKPDTVEILTHGVGFDRYYWDFAPGYSYVDVVASYNRASFFYDRLGVGQSSKPDAINVVQTPLEVEILQSLITMLKAGSFSNATFSTVIGTGHSFGSILTQAITSMYPTSLDTAILTGFSTNSTGMPIFTTGLNLAIAAQNQPYRFSGLSNGYLVSSSIISNQIAFFHAQDFDPDILNLAEATKGTVTFGELFTTTAVVGPASNFTGSVAVVNGAEDLPFCTGNCSYPTNLAQAALELYPVAGSKGTYLAPLTGHGVNLHYPAVAAYHYIQKFISNSTSF